MRRREFITLLGSAAAAWPLRAGAQTPDRMRRVGVLMSYELDNPESKPRVTAFQQGLQELGWTEGRNIRIDYRWGAGDAALFRSYAAELVRLEPDVVVANGTPALTALRNEYRSIPIVFVVVTDPVGQGFVTNLSNPGGNITGFSHIDFPLMAKWLEMLKETAPRLTRIALLFNPLTMVHHAAVQSFMEDVSRPLGVELSPLPVRDAAEINSALTDFGRQPGGLIVPPDSFTTFHRKAIMTAAAQHGLPAIYGHRYFAVEGGLMAYSPNTIDLFHRAPTYVDRILRGEKPGDLPVQAPTKFELIINLKTAKTLGLDLPVTLLVRADEVIE